MSHSLYFMEKNKMQNIIIDFSNVTDRDDIHEILIEALSLPSYYGKTLDALYDLASTMFIAKETEITLRGFNNLPEDLRKYGRKIQTIFVRVAHELAHGQDGSMMILNID